MKMNKKYITIIALSAALITPFACSKNFLTQTNTFQSTTAATFQKSSDVVSLINSIYDTYQNSDLLKKSIWYYANFQTHDWFNWGGDVVWNQFQISPTFGQLPSLWNNAYIGIIRANSAFGIISSARAKGIVTPALADRLTGEAYFLRGMTYYYLAGTFGGVPLELDTSGLVSLGLTPRSTQDSVFMQIVSDMQHAEQLLDSKTTLPASELGRATKGAAYGFEGAAQMWLKNYSGALAAFNNPELRITITCSPILLMWGNIPTRIMTNHFSKFSLMRAAAPRAGMEAGTRPAVKLPGLMISAGRKKLPDRVMTMATRDSGFLTRRETNANLQPSLVRAIR
jgi:hypothetical protein